MTYSSTCVTYIPYYKLNAYRHAANTHWPPKANEVTFQRKKKYFLDPFITFIRAVLDGKGFEGPNWSVEFFAPVQLLGLVTESVWSGGEDSISKYRNGNGSVI